MKDGFVYTRWLLTMTFLSLMGLLAVGMMTVHSKRTIRIHAVNLDRREAQLEELERRQNILDTDLASSLNPEYLKVLVTSAGLRLGPPREDRIIVVPSVAERSASALISESPAPIQINTRRIAFSNSNRREGD